MPKTKLILLLFFLSTIQLYAQDRTADRQELMNLLQERKQKFDAYSASLEKRSGIFGGKTKKDMQRSNEVLTEIVRTDNRIISTLNRVADFKTFEKVNMNYDLMQCNERVQNLQNATDAMRKQVDALTILNTALKNKSDNLLKVVYVLSILLVLSGIFIVLKRLL